MRQEKKQLVIEMLWRNGHVVRITDGQDPVWERRAGRSRKLLRALLERTAKLRKQMLGAMAAIFMLAGLSGCGGTEASDPPACDLNAVRCVGEVLQVCAQPHSEDVRQWVNGFDCSTIGMRCDVHAPWGCSQVG